METNKAENSKEEVDEKTNFPVKKTSDFIKLKLDKLMQNFDKPVTIPERPKAKQASTAPEFVRNVMGSSAGAGSGEFHVYRHLRRKEYSRQKFIQQVSEQEEKDEAYRKKLEENRRKEEEITAKKRAKRLKKKQKKKMKVNNSKADSDKPIGESDSDSDGDED